MGKTPLIEKAFFTMGEAALILGIGRSKAYGMARSGLLPSVRIGKSLRVPADRLRAWIEKKGQESDQREMAQQYAPLQ